MGEKGVELEIKALTKSYTKGVRENGQEKERYKMLESKVAIFEDFSVPLILPSATRWESVHGSSELRLRGR